MKYISIIISLLMGMYSSVYAQLVVDENVTADSLAKLISGQGIKITNVQVNCAENGYGKYNATSTSLGIEEGLLITTSTSIFDAVGPNDTDKSTSFSGSANNKNGYPLLESYTGREVWEYCEFEFDIKPAGDTLKFDFVFASEEYEEWVGSKYNDVFAFFISGPGIIGDPGANGEKNIALVPGTSTPVTINNVNQDNYSQYYENNDNDPHVQYDGFTKDLYAISAVQPCETYHLKLVVADCSDKKWDSGVFIEKINSNNVYMSSSTAAGFDYMIEGCNEGYVTFTRPNVTNQPYTVNYWVRGSATNGTDYPLIGSSVNPVSPNKIVIPANEASVTIPILPYLDEIDDDGEYINFFVLNPFCLEQIIDSLQFQIKDSLEIDAFVNKSKICVGDEVILTATGGNNYNWSPVEHVDDITSASTSASPINSTTYTVTVSASECTKSKSVEVEVSNMIITSSTTDVSCALANNGAIEISVVNGFEPTTSSWTGPNGFTSNSMNISNLIGGDYTINITDNLGCSASETFTINEAEPLSITGNLSSSNDGNNVACAGETSGSITLNLSGGTGNYTYAWTGPNGFSAATKDLNNLTAGIYDITITDEFGCTASGSFTLTEPENPLSSSVSPDLSQNTTAISCHGAADGSLSVNAAGGVAPYTYEWTSDNGFTANTQTINNLDIGNYNVVVTDANGCTTNTSFDLTQPDALSMDGTLSKSANGEGIACMGDASGSIDLSINGGNGSYTYSWTGPNGYISNVNNISNLAAGTYNLIVTDENNCTASQSFTLTEPENPLSSSVSPDLSQNTTAISCRGAADGSLSVNAAGGVAPYTYEWTSDNGFTANRQTIINLDIGSYNVVVTDVNGCTTNASFDLSQPDALSIDGTLSESANGEGIACTGDASGSIDISINGGNGSYTYSWTGPNGYVSNVNNISNLAAGTYNLIVTDENNCTASQSFTLTEPENILSSSISPDLSQNTTAISCHGAADGSLSVNAAGGVAPYTYEWNSDNGFTGNTQTINNLDIGSYNVVVTDANGCTTNTSFDLAQPDALSIDGTLSKSANGEGIACTGDASGSIDLSINGGNGNYTYSWTGPNGYVSNANNISNLAAGIYNLVVTDENNCTASQSFTLTEPKNPLSSSVSPDLSQNTTAISCHGAADGSLSANTAGGVAPYTYEWNSDNGFTGNTQTINNLDIGSYNVVVTDVNGCTTNTSFDLDQPTSISVDLAVKNENCNSSDGEIYNFSSGGTGELTFSWNDLNSSVSRELKGIGAGNYEVEIRDENNCLAIGEVAVLNIPEAKITLSLNKKISCHHSCNGQVSSEISGGTAPFIYNWSNGEKNSKAFKICEGTHTLTVTDSNGCISTANITVSEPDKIKVNPTINSLLCFEDSTGSVQLEVKNTQGHTRFIWSNGEVTKDISGLASGSYNVQIIDSLGCGVLYTINIPEPDPLVVELYSPQVLNDHEISKHGGSDGSIDASVFGGTTDYTFQYSNGMNSEDISNLKAGDYKLTVTDQNGCIATAVITLSQPKELMLPTGISPDGNGKNDLFFIQGLEAYENVQLKVINRWGNIVYENNDYDNTWRGTYTNGKMLPDGTYFVILRIEDEEINLNNYLEIRK